MALGNNARKKGLTTPFIVDEEAQEKCFEENVKSICDYVLTTKIKNNEREIRVLKALIKHRLDWHKLSLSEKGVDVEIIL